jgi:16S rRNA (uracil1498-N3)-methyltransferase
MRAAMRTASASRLFVDTPLAALGPGCELPLPETAVRHAQVLRLQPGDALTLFDGHGGQWAATVQAMGRRSVQVRLDAHEAIERELPFDVTLAVVMPAGDRMDFLVEKATELGAAAILPLMSERSVLRLSDERAAKRMAHWQALAVAACEQCGRNRVPRVDAVVPLAQAFATAPAFQAGPERWLLAWRDAVPWTQALVAPRAEAITLLSGPEGGFTDGEENAATAAGFKAVSLGSRVLRADTAPLAALAALGLTPSGLTG